MKCAILFLLPFAVAGQEPKYLTAVPLNGRRPVTITANEIERGGAYPSAVHMRGAVEIKAPVCITPGKNRKMICDGSMILRADEATYHEDTGRIEASGSVSVTPLDHELAKK